MLDSPDDWVLVVAILVLADVGRREWVRGDKRAVPLVIALTAVLLFTRTSAFARLPTIAKSIFFFLMMVFSIDQFNRAFGPRAHGHPTWAIRWGRRDVPKVTRALWFLRLGRLARLTTPVVMVATVMASLQWLQGEPGVFLGLSTPDWLTLLGVDMGIWLAALPHGRLRVAPLTNWVTMLFGLSFVVASVLFLFQQYIVRAFPVLVDAQVWRGMAHWAQENPPGSANGWALTVFGVGLTLVSLAETTRRWKPSDVIPDPGASAREKRAAVPSQSPSPRGQQKPPSQAKRRNRRRRR